MNKIIRIGISIQAFTKIFTEGNVINWKVNKGLPKDVILVHQRFNTSTQVMEFYFHSNKGKDLKEGCDMYDLPTSFIELEDLK